MTFEVHYSFFYPQNLQVSCVYALGPSAGYGDLVVLMTDINRSSTRPSGTVPLLGGGHPFVRIEVESPSAYCPRHPCQSVKHSPT
jgi:hypothetical protein